MDPIVKGMTGLVEPVTKGVGMIRAEIGLKNRQIINETHSFRCFLIYKTFTPTHKN
jgi:hypothetical protein